MSTEENKQPEENKSDKHKKNIVVLLILLALTGALSGYLLYTNYQLKGELESCGELKQNVEEEREAVTNELVGMLTKYDSLEVDNDSISDELAEERAKVEKLIEQAKNNEWTIYKLRKEAGTLREIMKGYVRTIDSLNTANIELRAQNVEVTEKLTQTKKYSEELESKNDELAELVRIGARLTALNMMSIPERDRRLGGFSEVNRARRTDRIKTCLTLEANTVAEEGERIVYVRIIAPGGRVLTEKSSETNMFEFEGTRGLYSKKKEVYYANQELDMCLFWDVTDDLDGGVYMVEAYADGLKIGTTKFELK